MLHNLYNRTLLNLKKCYIKSKFKMFFKKFIRYGVVFDNLTEIEVFIGGLVQLFFDHITLLKKMLYKVKNFGFFMNEFVFQGLVVYF